MSKYRVFKEGDIGWHKGFGYFVHRPMIANGPELAHWCKKIAKQGLHGNIVWLGPVPPGWEGASGPGTHLQGG